MGSSSGGSGGVVAVCVCLGSGADGTDLNPADPFYVSFFLANYFQKISKFFCQIYMYSVGKGRLAAGLIATV